MTSCASHREDKDPITPDKPAGEKFVQANAPELFDTICESAWATGVGTALYDTITG